MTSPARLVIHVAVLAVLAGFLALGAPDGVVVALLGVNALLIVVLRPKEADRS
jgi:hypothetical protein